MKENYLLAAVATANILTIGATATAGPSDKDMKDPVAFRNLNAASLSAIESSWLKLPPSCKARSFDASPVSVNQLPTRDALEVYAQFSQA